MPRVRTKLPLPYRERPLLPIGWAGTTVGWARTTVGWAGISVGSRVRGYATGTAGTSSTRSTRKSFDDIWRPSASLHSNDIGVFRLIPPDGVTAHHAHHTSMPT
jgi:hypothetical protein